METKIDFTGPLGFKRSLTIVAPDGLVTVIKEPRKFYKMTYWEEDERDREVMYPDVLLIPNNGVRISGYYYKEKRNHYSADWNEFEFHRTGCETRIFARNGIFRTQSDFTDDIDDPGRIVPSQGVVDIDKYNGLVDFLGKDVIQVDDRCKYQRANSVFFGLRGDLWEEKQQNKHRNEFYDEKGYVPNDGGTGDEITLYLFGETNYFTSNAQHYFAVGYTKEETRYSADESGWAHHHGSEGFESCTCYFGGWGNYFRSCEINSKGKKYYAYVETNYTQVGNYKYQLIGIHPPLYNTSNVELTKKLNFNGYTSSEFSLFNLRSITKHPNDTFKNAEINFNSSPLAAIRIPSETSYYYKFDWVKYTNSKELKITYAYPPADAPHKIEFSVPNELQRITENGQQYILFYRRALVNTLNNTKIDSNLSTFTFKFLFWNHDRWINETSQMPNVKGTLILDPIFSNMGCDYVTFRGPDHNGAMGYEKRDSVIFSNLFDCYGDDLLKARDVENWSGTTVRKELKLLKESTNKLKILFIKAHGGIFRKIEGKLGKSYSFLYKQGDRHVYLDFDDIKYLLKNRRQDEYYIIICNSCHGGGIIEDSVHENINDPSYSKVIPGDGLGKNYIFLYNDCAKSPAWASNGNQVNFSVGKSPEDSYSAQTQNINNKFSQVRSENIGILIELLQKDYALLKSMIKLDKFFWTDQTYAESINNASNLIIAASSDATSSDFSKGGKNWNQLLRKYPILFILYRVLGVISDSLFENSNYFDFILALDRTITKEAFIRDPNLFKRISLYFAKNNPNSIKNSVKYLLQSPDSISRALEGDTTEDAIKMLDNIITFFYDCFQHYQRMYKNTKAIFGRSDPDIKTFLLDDTPGIILNGNDFGKSCFPFCPGIDDIKKTREEIEKLKWKSAI